MKERISERLQTAVWAKGQAREMNVTLAFRLSLPTKEKAVMHIIGETCYKLIIDGEPIALGPNRAAHGYSRVAEYSFTGKTIVVEAYASNIENFDRRKATPFFACDLTTETRKEYSAEDFTCFLLPDRIRKVQRYSYQRAFAEAYALSHDRTAFYQNQDDGAYPVTETERVALPAIQPSRTTNPMLELVYPVATIDRGEVLVDENAKVWEDRSITLIGTEIEGFPREEWTVALTDEISRFQYTRTSQNADKTYQTIDLGRVRVGFIELEITAEKAGDVYVAFDEILRDGEKMTVDPFRNVTANICKWTLEKSGSYRVSTFEPYALRYARIICTNGVTAKLALRTYENPEANAFKIECSDERVMQLVEAARATFAHNAVDMLTDCPGRERAGWLSDSWFSSVAEYVFTGDNKAERAFLENYVYADRAKLPVGMVPCCYPSDCYVPDFYIPNWAMWYILELQKYYRHYGYDELIEKSLDNVRGLLQYFEQKENEFGVLENLTGWVFVEWSAANDGSHICGVNVPSNACYYATLKAVAEVYGEKLNGNKLTEKAETIRSFLLMNAYTGGFFVDNLVRSAEGKLVPTDNYTEVCQYYMFWFGCADKETHRTLFDKMLNDYGRGSATASSQITVNGKQVPFEKANMMYGVYMRLDLFQREGRREALFDECLRYFYDMTKQTGTLWENNESVTSCDHAFASYVIKWLLYALTGYDALAPQNGFATHGIGIDCKLTLPGEGKTVVIENDVLSVR